MAIKRAPKKTDPAGKCSRWRVIFYNPTTQKQEWFTVEGRRSEAEAFERQQKEKLARGTYIARAERKTFAEVAVSFIKDREMRGRRGGTLSGYQNVLRRYLLPHFGPWEVGKIRRADIIKRLDELHDTGTSAQTCNRIIRTAKAILFFAFECELVDRNVAQRLRLYERVDGERKASRGAFTEAEVQALLAAARPHERVLIGLLCFTGLRPGEAYALDWAQVNLDAGSLAVVRSWDGKQFQKPKTAAGERVVPLSSWLVEELRTYRADGGSGLVFCTRSGKPLSASNLRRDVWLPLKKRAGVRDLDLYSLRHSFATLARTAGEASFNVARALGHSKSGLVDAVYAAHTLPSGLAGVAEAVTARALGVKPQLRVIDGGRQDVSQPLDEAGNKGGEHAATR